MIKVIASDMDGTLLGDNHKVAPETVEAIREAQAAGIRFMIAACFVRCREIAPRLL